ncbi:MAG TPA: dihydrofolate reductase [Candidatus Dormibacteraeota bacterium]|nr:dihydrofolate reductase [Candidatus Dormibacteraeota bacterium]
MISLLVAMGKNRVIGFENDMPWHLPEDLKYFKEKTIDQTIIMGRKTFDSIGRALPNRRNIVLTKKSIDFPDGIEVIRDIENIYQWNKEKPDQEFFVIGGGNLYKQVLPFASRMYITEIDQSFEGDTYFPTFDEDEWTLTSKLKGKKNDRNPYDYHFLQYDRR